MKQLIFRYELLTKDINLKGYPNGTFMPNHNVTRAEALCALSKGLKCSTVDKCEAQEML